VSVLVATKAEATMIEFVLNLSGRHSLNPLLNC